MKKRFDTIDVLGIVVLMVSGTVVWYAQYKLGAWIVLAVMPMGGVISGSK